MLTKREIEEIAERAVNGDAMRYEIPTLIASLREAMEALEEEHREHHDNQIARSVGKTSRLLSLWNQVPSEDTRPESIRDLPDESGDGHNADPRFDDMHSGPSEEAK